MKCQEVVERMHRYIDHDLNEQEKEQLLAHVKTCKSCSEKFEILKKLSHDLEKLPDVSPPFSLVDRIMPQLDEIDRGRKEQGSTIQEMKKEAVVVPLSKHSGKTSRSFMQTRMGRILMGTAAAAVVLGVAVYQFQPEQLDQADIDNNYIANELGQADSRSVTGSGGGVDQKEDTVSPEPAEETPASPQTRSADVPDMASSTSSNTDASEPAALAGDPGKNQGESRADTNKTEPNTPSSSQTVTPKKDISDKTGDKNSSVKDSDKNKELTITPPTKPETNSGNGSTNKDGKTSSEGSGETEDKATEPDNSLDTLPPVSDSGISSITSDPSLNSKESSLMGNLKVDDKGFPSLVATVSPKWLSPDGQYWVDYKDQKVSIYRLDGAKKDQKKLLQEIEITGTYVKGSWSEDSLTYNYEIEVDGKSSKYSYTLTKEDQKAEVKLEEKNITVPVPQTETQSIENNKKATSEPNSK
ncbi:zf-HC2 domain-containing protein [Paenibacillus sp. Marseille-Q4541]|uniref:zf-HC2 domain-containing protein n=1 Tax=Paenibacillus sp. Marseille-Q4541 TaxID=2831522 RepID=UPI001BAB3FEF|nr:zf-HC2 domain-containing protein [Paenibacillus sp. Marseille-Q4541]